MAISPELLPHMVRATEIATVMTREPSFLFSFRYTIDFWFAELLLGGKYQDDIQKWIQEERISTDFQIKELVSSLEGYDDEGIDRLVGEHLMNKYGMNPLAASTEKKTYERT